MKKKCYRFLFKNLIFWPLLEYWAKNGPFWPPHGEHTPGFPGGGPLARPHSDILRHPPVCIRSASAMSPGTHAMSPGMSSRSGRVGRTDAGCSSSRTPLLSVLVLPTTSSRFARPSCLTHRATLRTSLRLRAPLASSCRRYVAHGVTPNTELNLGVVPLARLGVDVVADAGSRSHDSSLARDHAPPPVVRTPSWSVVLDLRVSLKSESVGLLRGDTPQVGSGPGSPPQPPVWALILGGLRGGAPPLRDAL